MVLCVVLCMDVRGAVGVAVQHTCTIDEMHPALLPVPATALTRLCLFAYVASACYLLLQTYSCQWLWFSSVWTGDVARVDQCVCTAVTMHNRTGRLAAASRAIIRL